VRNVEGPAHLGEEARFAPSIAQGRGIWHNIDPEIGPRFLALLRLLVGEHCAQFGMGAMTSRNVSGNPMRSVARGGAVPPS
jgi:hypothetical protein